MNPKLLSQALHTITIDSDLEKIDKRFYNHWAASTEFQYPIIKNLNIGFKYFIGLQEFNPLMLYDKGYDRLNQNFSIFISQNFWTFRKK